MPLNPKTKFYEPCDLEGVWTQSYEMMFWHALAMPAVRIEMEKMTGVLMQRTGDAKYHSDSKLVYVRRLIDLEFVARSPKRRLYKFTLNFEGDRKWIEEDKFHAEAKRISEYWGGKLTVASEPVMMSVMSEELKAEDMAAIEESERVKVPTEAELQAVRALQMHVLSMMHQGKEFSRHHKEGFSILRYRNGKYEYVEGGEWESYKAYESEEAFLAGVRQYFDWEVRRPTYPHSPPEVEAWKYIIEQVRR